MDYASGCHVAGRGNQESTLGIKMTMMTHLGYRMLRSMTGRGEAEKGPLPVAEVPSVKRSFKFSEITEGLEDCRHDNPQVSLSLSCQPLGPAVGGDGLGLEVPREQLRKTFVCEISKMSIREPLFARFKKCRSGSPFLRDFQSVDPEAPFCEIFQVSIWKPLFARFSIRKPLFERFS